MLELTVIGFDRIVRVPLDVVPRRRDQLLDDGWVDRGGVGDDFVAEEFFVRLRAFGAVQRIDQVRSADTAEILATVDPTPFVIASGPGGQWGGAWAIAVDPGSGRPAAAVDPDAYLQQAVMGGLRTDPTGPAREFVIVRWDRDPRSSRDHLDLALETSLLPATVYRSLR